jgi:D-alanyl-D-alanine carboxypeptidase/D-alanyl-D-alanine-endopeptidase (penicillin-binding protein 4)
MRITGVLLGLLLAIVPGDGAQKKKPAKLSVRIDKILAAAPNAAWGIQVVDLRNGATVYAKNEHQPFVPASNTKLFSTALALTRLGPEYRFKTTITAPAAPDKDGRVAELRFIGGGDPNLSGRIVPYAYKAVAENPLRHVEQFAQQLADRGVRAVDGDIIGDDSVYANEPFPEGWAVDDPIYEYGAPVSALFLNDGTFSMRVSPRIVGDPPALETSPPLESMLVHNRAVTGTPTKLQFTRLPGSNEFTMTGTVEAEREFLFAVDDPTLSAAQALREALLRRGIRVSGIARADHSPALAPGVPLVTHDSQPLIEALKVINKDSVNLHAEIVLLETGRVRTGIATRAKALEELKAFLTEIGIKDTEYTFEDGSGLSRKTLATPWALTTLLRFMYGAQNRDRWVDTLPIGGQDGTLGTRFGKDTRGRDIHAKTGSLSHVNALSGYAGDRYAFSILANNANVSALAVRRIIDQIALELLR